MCAFCNRFQLVTAGNHSPAGWGIQFSLATGLPTSFQGCLTEVLFVTVLLQIVKLSSVITDECLSKRTFQTYSWWHTQSEKGIHTCGFCKRK